MRSTTLAATTLILGIAGTATPAAAFHPFDEPMGYQAPNRSKPRADRPSASKPPRADAARTGAARGKPTTGVRATDDEADLPQRPQKRQDVVKGPPVLDGGGRPNIAAAAPPVVSFPNSYGTGSVIIDTGGRSLYYVLSSGTAYRYPISVGREGFTWTGTERISRVASWPDWRPPAEMKERQPGLPDLMTGGVRNPLGARALYLGNTLYRIHGTNDVKSIGQAASSGCFRMTNANVIHLARLAGPGTTVRVLGRLPNRVANSPARPGRS